MPAKRKAISVVVREDVLREAGYKCANPACRNVLTLQLHHMEWVRDGGGNEASNLLALCGHCHDLHTQGHIPKSAIVYWKGILHALNHAFNKESMDLLLYLADRTRETMWYSADAGLRFAGLIAAGLVEIAESQFSVGPRYSDIGRIPTPPTSPPTTAIRLRLSEKGRNLVESWMRGDQEAYVRGLTQLARTL